MYLFVVEIYVFQHKIHIIRIFVVVSFVILRFLCIFASENIQQQQQKYKKVTKNQKFHPIKQRNYEKVFHFKERSQ